MQGDWPKIYSFYPTRRSCITTMVGACLWSSGCRGTERTRPPYERGGAPSPAQLHAALSPRVKQLRITKAKVRDEMTPSAGFAALIQAPGRIHSSLFLKGQEIMSLVANEEGYGLRYNFNRGLAPGYYHGRKDRCAVQTFLGTPIEIDDLIAILLGGGPSSFRPDAVLSQSWDPRVGAERVVFFDRDRHRSLVAHFIWQNEAWVLAAATGYRYQGQKSIWEWRVQHLDFGQVQGAPNLPSRIKIGRVEGGIRRDLELSIQAATTEAAIPVSEPDDNWDDEDWEQADGEEQQSPAQTEPTAPERASQAKTKAEIPEVFVPNPSGLVDRGPLCRGQKRG